MNIAGIIAHTCTCTGTDSENPLHMASITTGGYASSSAGRARFKSCLSCICRSRYLSARKLAVTGFTNDPAGPLRVPLNGTAQPPPEHLAQKQRGRRCQQRLYT